MSIRIETKKIVVRGEQKREITKISLLKSDELPVLYTEGECVYLLDDGDMAYRSDNGQFNNCFLRINYKFDEVDFQKCIEIIKRCGDRLGEINRALAKTNADWHGEETFLI